MSVFDKEVTASVLCGHISDIHAEAVKMATVLDKTIVFKFNGYQAKVNANTTLEECTDQINCERAKQIAAIKSNF